MRRTAQPRNVATRQPIVKKPVKVAVPRKAGRKLRGDYPQNRNLDLSGVIAITDYAQITASLDDTENIGKLFIGTIQNANTGAQDVNVYLFADSSEVETISAGNNKVNFYFGREGESYGTEDKPIIAKITPPEGSILGTFVADDLTTLTQPLTDADGKYVEMQGPEALTEYKFAFASKNSTSGEVTVGTEVEYSASNTASTYAQHYFTKTEAGFIRYDSYEGTLVGIKEVEVTDGIEIQAFTKSTGENPSWSVAYKDPIMYPYRARDAITMKEDGSAVAESWAPAAVDDSKIYYYTNDLIFEQKTPELVVAEQIKTGYTQGEGAEAEWVENVVEIKEDTKFNHAIAPSVDGKTAPVHRYNEASYSVAEDLTVTPIVYRETAADEWIIDAPIEFSDKTSEPTRYDVISSANTQSMETATDGKLYFMEKVIRILQGADATHAGKLTCAALDLKNCTTVEVQGAKDSTSVAGTIECTQLVI